MRGLIGGLLMASYTAASAAQTHVYDNKLPVTPVNCAAVFTIAPWNKEGSANYERMRSYFHSQAVAQLGQDKADREIGSAKAKIQGFTLEQKMSQGRACGSEYLNNNPLL